MSDIRNINLVFACQEKLEPNAAGELYCHKCAHTITDFRCQSADALQEAMRQAGTRPVCGIFKRSQLSEKFARYAAAATIAITAASTTMCSTEDENAAIKPGTTPRNEPFTPDLETVAIDTIEHITFGMVATPSTDKTLYNHPFSQQDVIDVLDQQPKD